MPKHFPFLFFNQLGYSAFTPLAVHNHVYAHYAVTFKEPSQVVGRVGIVEGELNSLHTSLLNDAQVIELKTNGKSTTYINVALKQYPDLPLEHCLKNAKNYPTVCTLDTVVISKMRLTSSLIEKIKLQMDVNKESLYSRNATDDDLYFRLSTDSDGYLQLIFNYPNQSAVSGTIQLPVKAQIEEQYTRYGLPHFNYAHFLSAIEQEPTSLSLSLCTLRTKGNVPGSYVLLTLHKENKIAYFEYNILGLHH